jgi:hypothetical protein
LQQAFLGRSDVAPEEAKTARDLLFAWLHVVWVIKLNVSNTKSNNHISQNIEIVLISAVTEPVLHVADNLEADLTHVSGFACAGS